MNLFRCGTREGYRLRCEKKRTEEQLILNTFAISYHSIYINILNSLFKLMAPSLVSRWINSAVLLALDIQDAFSRRSATHTLMSDCRGTPNRFASLSNK